MMSPLIIYQQIPRVVFVVRVAPSTLVFLKHNTKQIILNWASSSFSNSKKQMENFYCNTCLYPFRYSALLTFNEVSHSLHLCFMHIWAVHGTV